MADQQRQLLLKKKQLVQKQELREIGEKLLQNPPSRTSKDALIKLLKQATTCLSMMDQSPSPSMLESMRPCLNAIAKPELLKHQDRDVKLLVATCICEITRITAPEAPFSDDVLRDIFHLIVGTFTGLGDSNSPSFGRRVVILETLARYRSCVVMLDLECDDLINEMFSTFFAVASDDHPEGVLSSMQTILILLIEESEDIQENLLLILLTALGRRKVDVSMAARRLAMNVIGHCAGKLESCIKQFLISSMSGDNSATMSKLDYHEIIYDTYRCAPQILSAVIPYLTGELLAEQLNTRLQAVKLLGDLFALPGLISEAFQPIFSEFLNRLTDRVVEVRMCVVEHVKICLLSNPFRVEAPQIIASLCDRLLDYEENVRKLVVAALCDVACCNLKSVVVETLKLVAERLRDKSLLVKRYTMERLAEIYRIYCLKCSDGSLSTREFEWIPGKILRCFYDKDIRIETIEVVMCVSLFPMECTTKDRVKHWVTVLNGFDKVEVKALEKILEQKQRLQQEMQKYLSLRQMHQDGEASELQKKTSFIFRIMSHMFVDPAKAEENFQILDQLKDANVWKVLTKLLDPNTSFHEAWIYRDDLLKILGERHPLYDFLGTLSMKCSYLLFDKEIVKELFFEITSHKSSGQSQCVQSCMNLLVILARFFPSLLVGTEEDLVSLLKEDDEILKEGVLHILARAGDTLREQLATTSSSVDLILERLCLEGSRKQAKYAVHALAAITEDDGLKSLSVLYKRLVDMLTENTHLPAILQSLGCIAQIAMPIYETRESEIVEFITSNILECSNNSEDNIKTTWEERSKLCLLKIFGIKTLVKSYLPSKDVHLRLGIEYFLTVIKNVLSVGEVSAHIESSPVDKVHMKLASAKAVLRLSKQWDHKIPIDVFHLTLSTSEVIYPEARKQFLSKVYHYIKDKLLDVKYACAFLYAINAAKSPEFEEYKQNLVEVIQMCNQAKARRHPMQCDANSRMTYPEYILPYLVHSVAHHSSFPDIHKCTDVGAFVTIYRQLHLFLSLLMHGNEDGKPEISNSKEHDSISAITSIFYSISCSEDIVDMLRSKNSHAVCDLGLSITKGLFQKQEHLIGATTLVPLPLTLYKLHEKKNEDDSMAHEVQTWLSRDRVLAYFESVMLETNGTVAEDDKVTIDNDKDDNDVPLGQMIRKLKSQGLMTKKVKKKKELLDEAEHLEKEFDILGVVREINLDGLDRSKNSGSDNGHGYILSGEADGQNNVEKVLVSRKRKRQDTGESISLASSKQHQSLSKQYIPKSSLSRNELQDIKKASKWCSHQTKLPTYPSTEREKEAHVDSTDNICMQDKLEPSVLASHLINKSFSPPRKYKGTDHDASDTKDRIEEAGLPVIKISNVQQSVDSDDSSSKSSIDYMKKRKRSHLAGFTKCSLKEDENQSLVGCRIKVWWPLDKQFYEGLVQSYDVGRKKHEILYNDGDVEVLHLNKERWERITDGHNPKKQPKSPNILSTNGMSSSSTVRWKGSPMEKVVQKQSGILEDKMERNVNEVESRGISGLSNSEPLVMSKCDTYSGNSEIKHVNASQTGDKKEKKSGSEEQQVKNAKLNLTKEQDEFVKGGEDNDDREEKFNSEGKVGGSSETERRLIRAAEGEAKRSDIEKSKSSNSGDSDDEPLSVWKRRAGEGKELSSSKH